MMSTTDDLVMPLESAEFVMQHAKHVTISEANAETLAAKIYESLKDKNCNYFSWKASTLNPKKMNEFAINWIFLVDTLNFSFWSDQEINNNTQSLSNLNDDATGDTKQPNKGSSVIEKYTVNYNGVAYSGYWAMVAAVNRALDEGYPIVEPNYYAHINESELRHIFRSDSKIEIPLVEQRVKILQETGKILLDEFQGSFLNCVKLANGSAKYLLKLIINYFPSYRDETVFSNRKITFYKRAQILIADIWACFEGQSHGHFSDIDSLTMFADYRVPQVLNYYNVIEYSDELKASLRRNVLLTSGSRFEIEIRAASILACNILAKQIRKLIDSEAKVIIDGKELEKPTINDILVDFYLWNYRVDNASQIDQGSLPFHKIRCIFY